MPYYDLTEASKEGRLQVSELEEIRAKTYESDQSYKKRANLFHDKHILRKEFAPRMKVHSYDSKLHLFLGKLRSRWPDPYLVSCAFPYGAVNI